MWSVPSLVKNWGKMQPLEHEQKEMTGDFIICPVLYDTNGTDN